MCRLRKMSHVPTCSFHLLQIHGTGRVHLVSSFSVHHERVPGASYEWRLFPVSQSGGERRHDGITKLAPITPRPLGIVFGCRLKDLVPLPTRYRCQMVPARRTRTWKAGVHESPKSTVSCVLATAGLRPFGFRRGGCHKRENGRTNPL